MNAPTTWQRDAAPPPLSPRSALLQEIEGGLAGLPQMLVDMLPQLEQGISPAQARGVDPAQIEERYRIAYELCQEESWRDALPVLLHLLALSPFDARFHFAAGMCLVHLEEDMPAAMAFSQALMLDPSNAASAFRLAETLERLGEGEKAAQGYRATVQLAQEDIERYHHLRELAEARLHAMGTAAPNEGSKA
jgi:predicted Zn-dependent protease